MTFKTKLSGFLIVATFLTGCASTRDAKLLELYTNKLDPLIGKDVEEVIPIITNQWEFKLQARWASANPSPETILKKNHRRAPFSRKETEEIFREKGNYNVLIYAQKGSEDETIEAKLGETRAWGWATTNAFTSAPIMFSYALFFGIKSSTTTVASVPGSLANPRCRC